MACDGLVPFCTPNLGACPGGLSKIIPAFMKAIDFLIKDLPTDLAWSGSKDFQQSPFFCFWHNIPLCLGFLFVPCCWCVSEVRTTASITGNACEHECLICCVLQMCFCYPCYKAKVRKDLRAKYGLKGAAWNDCLVTCMCPACESCQETNEQISGGGLKVPYCTQGNKILPSMPSK